MPKMKTHKGAAKRLKRTGSGKITHKSEGMKHLLRSKSRSRKRRLKVVTTLTGGNLRNMRRLIGG
jgi:large subunit ribosomal protein L35